MRVLLTTFLRSSASRAFRSFWNERIFLQSAVKIEETSLEDHLFAIGSSSYERATSLSWYHPYVELNLKIKSRIGQLLSL